MHDRRFFGSDQQYAKTQRLFDDAFIKHWGGDVAGREAAREVYYEDTGFFKRTFDWPAFREYVRAVGETP